MSADLFTVTAAGTVVGFSCWPWDEVYTPVVGCFLSGALLATADCGVTLASLQPPPFVPRFRNRLKRRVYLMLGLTPPAWPEADAIRLQGPQTPCWFKLDLPAQVVARLAADDPAVRIERLEDGAVVQREGAAATFVSEQIVPVEALLNEPSGASAERLDGFAAFLAAPPQHQYEVAFVEYLRRLPEEGARDAHLRALQRGDIGVIEMRRALLDSEEFRSRRVGYGARLGASLTSPLWREFARYPAPLDDRRAASEDGA